MEKHISFDIVTLNLLPDTWEMGKPVYCILCQDFYLGDKFCLVCGRKRDGTYDKKTKEKYKRRIEK